MLTRCHLPQIEAKMREYRGRAQVLRRSSVAQPAADGGLDEMEAREEGGRTREMPSHGVS